MFTIPVALAMAGVGAWLVVNSQPSFDSVELTGPRHPVTPEMKEDADKQATKAAPMFVLESTDKSPWSLDEKLKRGPAFVYFILDGCPCSVDAEPLFHKLYENFKGKISFAGAMPSNLTDATAWKKDNGTPYSLLLDPEAKTALSFGAERSVYCVLINQQGHIDRMWAGYSDSMLREANSRMAVLAKVPEPPIDTAYAPKELSSGCSLTEGVGK